MRIDLMAQMTVKINGEQKEIPEATTVVGLLKLMGIADQAVAVEINREVIPRKQHESTTLEPGDTIELVTLVGGG